MFVMVFGQAIVSTKLHDTPLKLILLPPSKIGAAATLRVTL